MNVYLNEYNILLDNATYIPLVSGLLHAYALTQPEILYEYRFMPYIYHIDSPERIKAKYTRKPDVAGFSVSMWNEQLCLYIAKWVKETWPDCLIVFGGPSTPQEAEEYFDKYPFIDIAVRAEGEEAFSEILIQNLEGRDFENIAGISWRQDGKCIKNTEERPQSRDLDVYPSPYLEGLFDYLFEETDMDLQATIETNRGCPFPCFSGDMYVTLPDKIARPDQYKYDTEASCGNDNHTHIVSSQDSRFIYQGKKHCIEIFTDNGLSVKLTNEHKVATVDNENIVWKKAEDIKIDDWLVCERGQNSVEKEVILTPPEMNYAKGIGRRCPETIKFPETLNEDLAWLIGYIIGDGCLPKDGRAALHVAITDKVRDKVIHTIKSLFGLNIKIYNSKATTKMQHGWVFSRMLVRFLIESCGIDPHNKLRVPRKIFESPRNIVKQFLNGLWDADGYWPKHTQNYLTTSCETLAKEVATLIYWIGDSSLLRPFGNKKGKPCYRVEWHDKNCEERHIGTTCIQNKIPFPFRVHKTKNGWMKQKIETRGCISRRRLKQIYPTYLLLDDHFAYTQVKKIEQVGVLNVYDVSNKPSGKISVSTMFSANCSFCYWGMGGLSRKYRYHGIERTRKEIEWCATHKIKYLFNADSNFGMNKRDAEIAQILVDTKKKYGYPEKFRTCYGKNTDDKIYEIAKLLHSADMEKGITLARQSNDETTLRNINRQNIKLDTYRNLQMLFNRDNIPVYSELILGLPGETYESWINGLEELMSAGLKNQIIMFLCQVLPNTEMNLTEYRGKHGLKTKHIFLTELHCRKRSDDLIPEYEEIIVGTNTMSSEDWKKAALFSYVTMLLHSLKLGFFIIAYLADRHELKHIDLIKYMCEEGEKYINWNLILSRLKTRIEKMYNGDGKGSVLEGYGNIYWEDEEAGFLLLSENWEGFYSELQTVVTDMLTAKGIEVGEPELSEVILYQKCRIPSANDTEDISCTFTYNLPEYFDSVFTSERKPLTNQPQQATFLAEQYNGDRWEYAKKTILWGRKSGTMLRKVGEIE